MRTEQLDFVKPERASWRSASFSLCSREPRHTESRVPLRAIAFLRPEMRVRPLVVHVQGSSDRQTMSVSNPPRFDQLWAADLRCGTLLLPVGKFATGKDGLPA